MRDVEQQLRAYAEAAEAAVPSATPVAFGVRRRGARALVAVAALLALVAGVTVVVALRDGHRSDPQSVISGVDHPTAKAPAAPGPGRWEAMPDAPIAGRTGHVVVATDTDLVVWGGRHDDLLADGAAWSFAERRWRKLAPSPLSPREGALALWTGEEVVIVGGSERGEDRQAAAYDPEADSWRQLPAPGFDASVEASDAVWTGTDLVVVGTGGLENEFHPTDAYALGLGADDDWRALSPLPSRSRVRGVRAVWTGDRVLVAGVDDGEPVTVDQLDVDANEWEEPIETGVEGLNVERDTIVWTGTELVISSPIDTGAAVDPATGEVRDLPPSGSGARYPAQVVRGVVTVGDRLLGTGDDWAVAAPIPFPREFPGTAVHDGGLYVWGGSGCGQREMCSGFVDPDRLGMVWTPGGARELPDIELTRLDGGGKVSLAELAAARPVVLAFGASWCVPCLEQFHDLTSLHEARGDEVAVVGVALGDDAAEAASMAEDTGATFPVLLDADELAAQALGIRVLPTIIFVATGGDVVETQRGGWNLEQLDAAVDAVLDQDATAQGDAMIEVVARQGCGPEDASGVEATLSSPEIARDVHVELVAYTGQASVHVGRSALLHLPADEPTSRFVPFSGRLAALGDGATLSVVARNAAGANLGATIVPFHQPTRCGG